MASTAQKQRTAPEDVYIAVMGVTGSGKSSFIQTCTGQEVKIGHSLRSETQDIQTFDFFLHGRKVILIDTPGFDDSERSDLEVLKSFVSWFTTAYRDGIRLSGIIYLHSIAWNRMSGSIWRNLLLFKEFCGDQSFSSVILLTTFWDVVDPEIGKAREKELVTVPEFWGNMVKKGCKVMRKGPSRTAQLEIVSHLVLQGKQVVLAIQREIVEQRRELGDTAVGKLFLDDKEKRREKLAKEMEALRSEMRNAMADKDPGLLEALIEEKYYFERRLMELEKEIQNLKPEREMETKLGREQVNTAEKRIQLEREKTEMTIQLEKEMIRPR